MSAFGHFISARSTITDCNRMGARAIVQHRHTNVMFAVWRAVFVEDKRDCVTEGGPTSLIRWIFIFFSSRSISLYQSIKRPFQTPQLCAQLRIKWHGNVVWNVALLLSSETKKKTHIHLRFSCRSWLVISFFCFHCSLICSTPLQRECERLARRFVLGWSQLLNSMTNRMRAILWPTEWPELEFASQWAVSVCANGCAIVGRTEVHGFLMTYVKHIHRLQRALNVCQFDFLASMNCTDSDQCLFVSWKKTTRFEQRRETRPPE